MDILALLLKKAQNEVPITIEYDPSASSSLKKILPATIAFSPIQKKGLMHHKIAVLDHTLVLLGSANLTETSLRHHDNLVLGIRHEALASFLERPNAPYFSFSVQNQQGELFLFPDPAQTGLRHLLQKLKTAKTTICIAMFTLTHPDITTALIAAKQRGVLVTVVADYYTAKGASKKALETLRKEGVAVYSSQGRQLLHHKWALIDDTSFVLGSANWTKAAFSKNKDFLLFLSPLSKNQQNYLKRLWDVILSEALAE